MPDSAALYDWECRHVLHRLAQDVGFWLDWARAAKGPILELACGTGRLTLPLSAAGVPLVGLDNDPVMLRAAKRRQQGMGRHEHGQGELRGPMFVAADMRRFALAQHFGLVFVGYNSLQLLTAPGDVVACLRVSREHLASGGLVGVEVTDFQYGGADGPDDGSSPLPLAEAEGIRLSGTLVHDLVTRTSRYRRHFSGDGWHLENDVVVRSLNLQELRVLFDDAGLTLVESWSTGTTVRAIAAAAGRLHPASEIAGATIFPRHFVR